MNQQELNKVALDYLHRQGFEVAEKLRQILVNDVKDRSRKVSGSALLYIHNTALYECLAWLNAIFMNEENVSNEALEEYRSLVEDLRSKLWDIVKAFKDFQPTE